MSSSSIVTAAEPIQLRGPRYAVEAHNALSDAGVDKLSYVFNIATEVWDAVSQDERGAPYAVAAYDLCNASGAIVGHSNLLVRLSFVVVSRVILQNRVPADADQKVGTLSAGAAWMLLGMSPLITSVRELKCELDTPTRRLLQGFDMLPPTDNDIQLHALVSAIGRIVSIVAESEALFHPPPVVSNTSAPEQ